jgi:hypothetical protein
MDEASIFDHGHTTSPIPLVQWLTKIWNPSQWFMDLIGYPQVLTIINLNQVLLETLSEVLERDDGNQWDDAIQNEYNSFIKKIFGP